MNRVLLSGILIAVSTTAMANYTVKGSVECVDIVKENENEHYREYNKWWLLGYFTARNYDADQEVGDGVDSEALYKIALTYCRDNPENDWDDAAIYVYGSLE